MIISIKSLCRITPFRRYSRASCKILGIETSCDDTGVAVIDDSGNILGESLISQEKIHLNNGGILPPLARDLHAANLDKATNDALQQAGMKLSEVDAIAVTNRPGLSLSLSVGLKHAKSLARRANLKLLPIHHMEAHALTARINPKDQVQFPFLVLLISGGHCLLSLVRDVDCFLTLGTKLDDSPGEALDKIARRLKLANFEETSNICGGKAIEWFAEKSIDPLRYPIAEPLLNNKDCLFSFAGIKNSSRKTIVDLELQHDVIGDGTIPHIEDMCAAVQLATAKHLCRRLQRAIQYLTLTSEEYGIPKFPTLVVSGGVASNAFIKTSLSNVANVLGWRLVAPPPRLCTDNGVMIAWNGVERFVTGKGIVSAHDLDKIDIEPKCALGVDISKKVAEANIKCSWVSNKVIFPTIYGSSRNEDKALSGG